MCSLAKLSNGVSVASIKKDHNSKFLRGQASYHLQQAAEKLIKIQIYTNSSSIDYHKMYEHDIKKLMNYGSSLGITIEIPNDIKNNAMTITAWEASGRYDLRKDRGKMPLSLFLRIP